MPGTVETTRRACRRPWLPVVLALGVACLWPVRHAHAVGPEVGSRLALGLPMGNAFAGKQGELEEIIGVQLPVWLELGYRILPTLSAGLFLTYGFGFGERWCFEARACDASTYAPGLQLQYHMAPGSGVDSWLGGGIGIEQLTVEMVADDAQVKRSLSSTLWLLQFGVDFGDDPRIAYGPFVGMILGRFSDYDDVVTQGNATVAHRNDIDNPALHAWFLIGLRGTLVFAWEQE